MTPDLARACEQSAKVRALTQQAHRLLVLIQGRSHLGIDHPLLIAAVRAHMAVLQMRRTECEKLYPQ